MNFPQNITDVNIFIDGIGHLGTSKKVSLPKIEQARETQTAGGFERSVDTGIFKELEAEVSISQYTKGVFTAMAAAAKSADGISVVVKGSIFQEGKRIQLLATLQGSVDIDDGELTPGQEIERKITIKPNRYILELDGSVLVSIDTTNMIAIIDGTDVLEDLRSQIG